jgi:hypothetical protein
MWLVQAYIEKFKFWGMVGAAMILPGIFASKVGRYIAKVVSWDDSLPMAVCFFAALALEVWAYDQFMRWRFFRANRK